MLIYFPGVIIFEEVCVCGGGGGAGKINSGRDLEQLLLCETLAQENTDFRFQLWVEGIQSKLPTHPT